MSGTKYPTATVWSPRMSNFPEPRSLTEAHEARNYSILARAEIDRRASFALIAMFLGGGLVLLGAMVMTMARWIEVPVSIVGLIITIAGTVVAVLFSTRWLSDDKRSIQYYLLATEYDQVALELEEAQRRPFWRRRRA